MLQAHSTALEPAGKPRLSALGTGLSPLLKWAGGKRWQLPAVQPLWRPHHSARLVEPFCGGMAMALGFAPKQALINDVNPHLINFYKHVQTGFAIEIEMANDEKLFYAQRERFNALVQAGQHESAEAAGLFYFLNRTGYNGLCRFNASGGFNVPFGRYVKIQYRRTFPEYAQAFAKWSFASESFVELELRTTDFVYADPPYDVKFTAYSKGGFSWENQVQVAEWLAKHAGPVILVNQATERIKKLYQSLGYQLEFLNAPRRISCTGDRTDAKEVLAVRNL